MKTSIWIRALALSIVAMTACTFTACVSIRLKIPKPQRSKDMKFTPPPSTFEKTQSPDLDYSWRQKKNGNSISVLSECHDTPDATLEQIQEGVIDEISDAQPIEVDPITYNGVAAIHSIIDGTVEGVKTEFELVIFKKHDCTYILTYAGVTKAFGANQLDFERFVKGFRVP